ncbi:MAG: DUF1501 domain-containing protein [Hyphomicrobium sp.]
MLTRRELFLGAGALLTVPGLPALSLAAAPTDSRLVVLILRGGMDGLDVVQPYSDPAFAALRPKLARTPATGLADLDGYFGLHPGAVALEPLFRAKELGFVHAVSLPFANRSHFEAQDLLEFGQQAKASVTSGWLNRFVGLLSAGQSYSIDIGGNAILAKGPSKITEWAANTDLVLSATSEFFLRRIYAKDALFLAALDGAIAAELQDDDATTRNQSEFDLAVATAVNMLNGEARVASLTMRGWDTHLSQGNIEKEGQGAHRMQQQLQQLAQALLTFKTSLGPHWERTVIVGVSEFGRTARQNGTLGTDHGTGGLMIVAGGAIRNGAGGRVQMKRWPGVADDQLFEGRDLMPTDDVRRYLAWLLSDHFAQSPADIARLVFPGVEMGERAKLL